MRVDRRRLMGCGGAGLLLSAAGAAPALAQAEAARREKATVLEDMGAWIAALRYEDIPAATVRKVRYLLLDTFGCALGAVNGAPVRAARQVIRSRGSNPQASVIGTGWKTSVDEAAFLNAMQIRYLDFNDYAAFGYPHHPSINLAAALAVAELRNLSGRDVILGLVVGYDVHIKVRDASERRGFDMPSLEAQYGSAAAAARLMGLDAKGIANTLSIAASNANTLSEVRAGDTLTNAKGTAEALAVRAGTFAALLSKAGIDYPPTMMDGEFSYKALVSRGLKEDVLRKRSGDFEIMKSSMKMWPSIGTSQAPIAAALQFRDKGIKAADIKSVTLRLSSFGYDQQKGFLSHNITTREHADHSCPYVLARAFMDGDVREEDFDPRRFRDPAALAFMEKITVLEDPELTKNGADILGCRLEITLNNGSSQKIDMLYAPGSVQNPATDQQVEHKFFDLAEGTLGKAGARRARDAILSLDRARDLKILIAALSPPKGGKA